MNPDEWKAKCSQIKERFAQATRSVLSAQELENLKILSLGRKGELTELLRQLKDYTLEERRESGPIGNQLKDYLSGLFDARLAELEQKNLQSELEAQTPDLTLEGDPLPRAYVHPLTKALRHALAILARLGFSGAIGPLIEDQFHNFDALNVPLHHPCRDEKDTFYIKDEKTVSRENWLILRTHTSNVQIRYMEKNPPPVRIVSAGRVFRHDAFDARHSPVFHQIEGLYVDKDVSMADLKYTLVQFYSGVFGRSVEVRFRPSYFPFVEPGVEVDARCPFCSKTACPVCHGSGWIEMGGAGIVHPGVFKAVNYDPEKLSGFAFGLGVERIAMLLFGINDIRVFYQNDARVLRQFK